MSTDGRYTIDEHLYSNTTKPQDIDKRIDRENVKAGSIKAMLSLGEQHPLAFTANFKYGGVSPNKAREILHDGTVYGRPITDKQRRFFGAMSKGNTMKYEDGGSVTKLSDNVHSQPIFRFNGPSHDNGGIPINYKGVPAEVEGDETGWVDDEGDLNIFGNMYVPNSNMKFKALSKKIADEESKSSKMLDKSIKLLDNNSEDDKFERLALNAGAVMGKSAIYKQQRLTRAKEDLSTLQNHMLDFAKEAGVEPDTLFGSARKSNRMAKLGDVIPNSNYNRYQSGGDIPEFVPNYEQKFFGPTPNVQIPYDRLGYDLQSIPTRGNRSIDSSLTSTPQRIDTMDTSYEDNRGYTQRQGRTYNKRLGLAQIAPELYALATNRPEFVTTPRFTPTLYQPYNVSFQDRLNNNASTFRQLAQSTNNPLALAQLAAQKYAADNAVKSEEFRTNQSIQNQITNQNVALINEAQLQNLGFQKQADTERSQNLAATKATNRAALTSIASKDLQNKQYNRGLSLFSQMVPNYEYNPDSGQWEFAGGNAPLNVNGLPVDNAYSPYDTKSKDYIRNDKGKIIRTEETKRPGIMRLTKRYT